MSSEIENFTFQCPKELLPINTTTPWRWDFGARNQTGIFGRNITSLHAPQIVTFRLNKEKDSPHFKRTIDSLALYNYSNVCVAESVNGFAWEERGDYTDITNVNMTSLSRGAVGCFTSHLSVWRLGLKYNIPIISLESDTSAIAKWNVHPDVYKEYDLLFLHNHKEMQRKCRMLEDNSVREGLPYWYATGAILYTNNRPEKMESLFKEEFVQSLVNKPVGHWLNKVWSEKKWRVGSLCPNFFEQRQDHVSTIQNLG